MKRQGAYQNLLYQFLYQFIVLCIPLILSPYLTRTLGSENLGIYSYTYSIAYYFVIFAMLGIAKHGQRVIAQNSSDELSLRKTFWSLFALHIAVSVVSLVFYFSFAFLFGAENKTIYLIQGLYVASALFDITWLFYGLENFKNVVIKNALVKLGECILIFTFVKSSGDIYLYTLITGGGVLLGQIIMLPQAINIIKPIRFAKKDLLQHIKPLLVFSIATIAVSLYTVFGKTLLGLLATMEDVAFYEYSNKIINVPKVIITVVGTVMFPRACRLAQQGDWEGQTRYMNFSFFFAGFFGIGVMFGLLAIGSPFAIQYFGTEFAQCGEIMMTLSPLIFIIGVGDIIRTQYMIPNHMDIQYNICILMNAVINVILSLILIPIIGVYGAVVGTICAELFGLTFQLVICRKYVKIKSVISNTVPFIIIGIIMYVAMKVLAFGQIESIIEILINVSCGSIVYLILSCLYVVFFRKDISELFFRKKESKRK